MLEAQKSLVGESGVSVMQTSSKHSGEAPRSLENQDVES